MWDIEAAVAEVEWARAAGLKSINFPAPRDELPPYNDRSWEPLWSACEANGMTLSCHGGLAPGEYTGVEAMAIFFTEVAWFSRRAMPYMILGGVFERHPGLNLVITELRGDWVPELLNDMDSAYLAPQSAGVRKVLPRLPSEYWRQNCFVGNSFMSRQEAVLATGGGYVDNYMWGTDYPHEEGTWPRTRLSLRKTYAGLPAHDVAAMLGGNAARVFGLDWEGLAAVANRIGPTVGEISEPLEKNPDGHLGWSFREVGKWA
jgi:predicted TIM-barrel fold metal-dependent hydrolase